jgi:hypothetical protein
MYNRMEQAGFVAAYEVLRNVRFGSKAVAYQMPIRRASSNSTRQFIRR